MRQINQAWRTGRPREIEAFLHPNVVMVFPEFGRSRVAVAMIAGFEVFCTDAKYNESDLEVDVVGNTETASFTFAMLYEREGHRYRPTGRDLWMFGMEGDKWLATWRTMLDVQEEQVS